MIMKEKESSKTKTVAKVIKAIILSMIALIIGLLLFVFLINPISVEQKLTKHTKAYFQALQEGDIQTASQYIGVDGTTSEWIEKVLKLQQSNLTIHSIEDLNYGRNDNCSTVSLLIVAERGGKKDTFSQDIFTNPPCTYLGTFEGVTTFYYEQENDSELVKDARFLISSDVTR